MFDWARISKMIQFQEQGVWPLGHLPKDGKTSIKMKFQDMARIVLNKGPVKSFHNRQVLPVPTECFRYGTRAWEYPWVMEMIQEHLEKGKSVLDCGCGVNGFPDVLGILGYRAMGLDYFVDTSAKQGYGLNSSYVKKNSNRIEFINGGMENIPLPDNSVDAATCISVMEHIVIDHHDNPEFHCKCLNEVVRVLRPGGLFVCTYDTILNRNVVFGGTPSWGAEGWYYKDDISYLLDNGMRMAGDGEIAEREEILGDEDTFFIPPDFYFAYGYGSGFMEFGKYHRLTSVGFALIKAES